jgi:maleate isomerase
MHGFSYGPDGLLGCATPQANRTVEPELRRLLPETVNLQMARSVASGDARTRLLAYFSGIEATIGRFGGMPLDAFGFACTASSYLLEPGQETAELERLERHFGFPLRTASGALDRALRLLGARRLAIGSPYPDWIHQACLSYWENAGYEIVQETTAQPEMGDTRAIYELEPHRVADHLERVLGDVDAHALLITGTGLPTLPIRARLQAALGMPVLSANLCLAWDLMETIRPGGAAAQALARSIANTSAAG